MTFPSISSAVPVAVGYFSWDVTNPGVSGQFDVVNQTGANSSGDDIWPVLTPVSFSDLGLVVHFMDGSVRSFGQDYFSLSADGYSFDGSAIGIGAGDLLPIDATLRGLFGPLGLDLFDGTHADIQSAFTATIDFGFALQDGASQVIWADTAPKSVPEPGMLSLFALGIAMLLISRWQGKRKRTRGAGLLPVAAAVVAGGALSAAPAFADSTPVKLNSWTAPDKGNAGTTLTNLTASGLTLPQFQPLSTIVVTLSTTCGGPAVDTAAATSFKQIIGGSYRIQFRLPAETPTGGYFASLSTTAPGYSDYVSSNCSQVNVAGINAPHWATLIGRAISVPEGTEAYRCRTIQVPNDIYITAVRSPDSSIDFERTLTVSTSPPLGAVGDFNCNAGTLGDKMLYAAAIGTNDLEMPSGVALHVKAGQFLTLNAHVSNDGASPIADAVTQIEVQTADASIITQEAELTYAGTYTIAVPNDGARHTAIGGCTAPVDYTVFALWPHLHKIGTETMLTVTHNAVAATVLRENFELASQRIFPVNLTIRHGDQVQLQCSYLNPANSAYSNVTFGDSTTSENCFVGQYRTPVIPRDPQPGSFVGSMFECVN